VWGNWFIVTLVTHSSGVSNSGVRRGIHHKCKHPLNSTKLYVSGWVESSLSVLIWKDITCLGWCMYVGLRTYIWLHWWNLYGSSLPCLLVWLSCMLFFYFCDDHQLVDVSRCEKHSRSTEKRWFRCIVRLGWTSLFVWAFVGVMAHVLLYSLVLYLYLLDFSTGLLLASWCA